MNSDMLKKVNPIVLIQSAETEVRPSFLFTGNDIFFAFSIADNYQDYPPDSSIMTFTVSQVSGENGFITNEEKKELRQCTGQDFARFPKYQNGFKFDNLLCLKNKTFNLNGFWDEPKMNYLLVHVEKCINSTESEIICKSNEEIEEFINNKYFYFYVEQKTFDMNNQNDPISSGIKLYYRGLSTKQSKYMDFFFKKTRLLLDEGFLYNQENLTQSYSHDTPYFDSIENDQILFEIYIHPSQTIVTYQRRYEKIYGLLANLGGILNSLIMIGAIMIKLLYDWKINELILNKLYAFGKAVEYKTFLRSYLSINSFSNNYVSGNTGKNSVAVSKVNPQHNEKAKSKLNMKLIMSFWELIVLFFKKKKKRTNKEKIYAKFMEESDKKIDLLMILQKLEEIDRLKFVLLSEQQLFLFNSIDKRYQKLNETTLRRNSCTTKDVKFTLNFEKIEESKRKSITTYFQKLQTNAKNANQNQVENRFLELLNQNNDN